MRLSGLRCEEFRDALLDAYPTPARLTEMVRFKLERNLSDVALGDDLREVAFRLIESAETGGWTEQLIVASFEGQPNNELIQRFYYSYIQEYAQQMYISPVQLQGKTQQHDAFKPGDADVGMTILTVEENNHLQNILIRHNLLIDAGSRYAVLTNCGLEDLFSTLPLASPIEKFVQVLCDQLSHMRITSSFSIEPDLVVFLKYVSQTPHDESISFEDKEFLEKLVDKCKQRSLNRFSKQNALKQLIARERQKQDQFPPITTAEPIKIDKEIIVSYDLETQMAKFRQKLNYGDAFAFAVGGHSIILRDYIIARMSRELTSKMARSHRKIEISLYLNDDIEDLNLIEKKILAKSQCNSLKALFENNPKVDIMLVIWNYTFPLGNLRTIATFFWGKVNKYLVPFLKYQGQCFVAVLANADVQAKLIRIDNFVNVSIPRLFEIADLVNWVNGRLKDQGVKDDVIEHCLNRLRDQHGHLIGTYQEMEHIIADLQGRQRIL